MHSNYGNTALITGASAGIGVVYAEQLAAAGVPNLVLVARRRDRLEAVKENILARGYKGRVHLIPCDLRSEDAREGLKALLDVEEIEVDLLINNAGFGYVGKMLSDEPHNERDMVTTNCIAPLHLAQLFTPGMRTKRSGGIINIASIAAYPPIPYMATYAATKAFLLNWSVALRQELRSDGLRVLAVCPGPTESDFHIVAGVEGNLEVVSGMAAIDVVRASLRAYQRGDAICTPGVSNVILTGLTRLFPKSWVATLGELIIRSRVPASRR